MLDENKAIDDFLESLGKEPPFPQEKRREKLLERWIEFVTDFLKKDGRMDEIYILAFENAPPEDKILALEDTALDFNHILDIYNQAAQQLGLVLNSEE